MFDDAHCIFVEGKGKQIFDGVVEKGKSVFYGESLHNFLDEVGGVVVPAEFVVFLSQLEGDEGELFGECEL